MNLGSLTEPGTDLVTSRFFLVSYLPAYASGVFLLVVVWAGAPGQAIHFDRAWQTATGLGVAELVLISLAILLVAVLTHPFQLALVRFLQGEWPRPLAGPAAMLRRWQEHARARLKQRARDLPPPRAAGDSGDQVAGAAATRLTQRFPAPEQLRPTALGNVLAATQGHAGKAYGWDAAVAWPRLYPVLGGPVRTVVDDRRNTMDAACRLAVFTAVTGLTSLALLARSGWWMLLALIPLAVSWLSYRAAVVSAVALGEAIHTAFDLHRFDLIRALHLPLPEDQDAERKLTKAICLVWRQSAPISFHYERPAPG